MLTKIVTIIFFLIILGISNLCAQSFLEESAAIFSISVKIPSQYKASKNKDYIYPVEITKANPIPELAQQFRQKPVKGDVFFNVFFGMVNSILEHSNDECIVIVYIPPVTGGSCYGKIATDSAMLRVFKHIPFERIKTEFSYESPLNAPSELAAMELYSMLTHYPSAKAEEMFNAGTMVSYPLNFRKNIFQKKFTRGRAVVIGKDRRHLFLYFMLTDKSVLDFDKYLEEFNRAFVFY
jgi:hypothetical protein